MKAERFVRVLVCIIISGLISNSMADASVVDVYCNNTGVLGLLEYEYVSDVVQKDDTLCFLITNAQTGYAGKIISIDVTNMERTFTYLPSSISSIAGMNFIDMEIAASGELWTAMWDGGYRYGVAVFENGNLINAYDCTTKPYVGNGAAIWKHEGKFFCINGTQISEYSIPTTCATVGDFAVVNGRPVFVDWINGEVEQFLDERQTEVVFALRSGQKFSYTDLEACGDEAYLSYQADKEAGLIRLSDGVKLSDQVFYIVQGRIQADGSTQLIMADNGWHSIITYVQGTVKQNECVQRLVETYLIKAEHAEKEVDETGLPVGFYYTDSQGNQWIYHLRSSAERGVVTKVAKDGTAIRLCSANIEKTISIYWNDMGVSFDSNPYVTDTGHMMVPVRGVAALLGADVKWNGNTRTVTISKADRIIELSIDSSIATVDGKAVSLGATTTIVGGRTMVPLRFLTETLDGKLKWIENVAYITG